MGSKVGRRADHPPRGDATGGDSCTRALRSWREALELAGPLVKKGQAWEAGRQVAEDAQDPGFNPLRCMNWACWHMPLIPALKK